MNETKVTLETSDGPMDLHAFIPGEGAARRLPAVILLQEAFGVNHHIRRVCLRVAALGYSTFSPELFHRIGPGATFGYDEFTKVKPVLAGLTTDRILEDLKVAHRHIIGRPDVDASHVASWGFCMGGWASMLAACELPLAAAVSFYGGGMVHPRHGIGFTPIVDRMSSIRCPVLLVYGGRDTGIPPDDIGAVQTKLTTLKKVHEVQIYPEGGHGFFCEDRSAYNREAAEAAWTRATDWLAVYLE